MRESISSSFETEDDHFTPQADPHPELNGTLVSDRGDSFPHSIIAADVEDKEQNPSEESVIETHIPSSPDVSDEGKNENTLVRVCLRTLTYFIYDGISVTSERKEMSRIGKALVELLVDERFPTPHRSEMTLSRKCKEFLLPPAASSFAWFIVRRLGEARRRAKSSTFPTGGNHLGAKALWTVIHRVGRQALIYRLFFRIGSIRYSLASALGIVCCFFKDSIFREIYRLRTWPQHFSTSQGLAAVFRSILYAASFSLPLQDLSKLLQESPRRRGNVKKIIFAVILSQITKLQRLHRILV